MKAKVSCTNCDYLEDCIGQCPKPQKQSVTIEGWVARSKYGYLNLFGCLPKRYCGDWLGVKGYFKSLIPTDSFPDLKWEDEPLRCRIKIEEI